MKAEPSLERLLQVLQEMENQIARQIQRLEEQIVQAGVDHLRQSFEQESRELNKYLEKIDAD